MTSDQLSMLCNLTSRKTWMRQPFGIVLDDGRQYAFATDGKIGVLARMDGVPMPDDGEATTAVRRLLLGDREAIGTAAAEAVAAWAGPREEPEPVPCDGCGGDGRCECPRCEKQHECDQCKGTGQEDSQPDPREGWVANLLLDRNQVAKAIGYLDGPCCVLIGHGVPSTQGAVSGIVEFRAADWRLLVAAMAPKPEPADGWPRLEIAGKTEVTS